MRVKDDFALWTVLFINSNVPEDLRHSELPR